MTLDNETYTLIAQDGGIGFECGISYLGIYNDDGVMAYESTIGGASVSVKIEQYAITVDDDFKNAVRASSPIILEMDGTGAGTYASPFGLVGFTAETAINFMGKDVMIVDTSSGACVFPLFSTGLSSDPCGFYGLTDTQPTFGWYGFTSK